MRIGANVQVAYFDQQREQLDPERTVADIVGEGNDTVTVNGEPRHIIGYLNDFLFPAERARSPVKALSGGERNRLLLARLFTRPANVLVLDEPTNDLDIETLELLEAQLAEWPGTLLLVSHDRVFLDNVVTSTIVFEGEGRVQEYVGGYEDWMTTEEVRQVHGFTGSQVQGFTGSPGLASGSTGSSGSSGLVGVRRGSAGFRFFRFFGFFRCGAAAVLQRAARVDRVAGAYCGARGGAGGAARAGAGAGVLQGGARRDCGDAGARREGRRRAVGGLRPVGRARLRAR